MTSTSSTTRRLLISGLIIVLILTAAIILDGPPTLTNKTFAKGDVSALARSGYYGSHCSPYPYCTFVPIIMRQLTH
jgi:hypothetical protein